MATVASQHQVRYLGFFKNFILRKTAANFTKISRKHVFAISNMDIFKNKVKKKKLEKIFPKFTVIYFEL